MVAMPAPSARTALAPLSSIELRSPRFDVESEIPRHWHGGRRAITNFFDNLSVFFPVGERFFIASVRAHRDHVRDPHLAEDVKGFCAQEGVHGREHDRYNQRLRAHGYPIVSMERRVDWILRVARKMLPRRTQLAVTCALEHFTALMAHFLLADPRMLEGAHPTMAALWRWHAAEENEHKTVAYDVYLAAGGGYVERAVAMSLASTIFWAKVFEHQVRMMAADRILFSPREWGALGKFLFLEPGGMFRLVGMYFRYFRPGFHPRDIDSSEILEAWRREYASSPVYHRAA
jgi:uncharacterized protein